MVLLERRGFLKWLVTSEERPKVFLGPIGIYTLTTITALALGFKFYRIFQELKGMPPEECTLLGVIKRLVFAL
jgi:hypothetical protein